MCNQVKEEPQRHCEESKIKIKIGDFFNKAVFSNNTILLYMCLYKTINSFKTLAVGLCCPHLQYNERQTSSTLNA